MSAYASRSSKFGPYAGHYDDGSDAMAFEAGERLGGPVRRRSRIRALLNLLVLAALAGAAGWAWLNHRPLIEGWSAAVVSAVAPLLERKAPEPILTKPQDLASLPALETREPPPATLVPSTATVMAPAAEPPAAQDDPAADDANAPVEKLPPAVADPSDPYQVRALAAGLHPGLSRALLSQLSDADYRNAEIAIKTALAETPDTKVFEYPKKRKPELALFQVKFVRGIAPDCRRFVVMVTKERWLTTAMPMEKCGIKAKPEKPERQARK